MTTGCRKQNASWRAKIPIRYWKIKVSRIICKKKKLKTHSTLCREPQGPLTYQVERLILKNCHQQTFGWLQGIILFEWTCFHDEKQAFFLPSRSESFHFPFHKFHSSRESQALLFSLCVELSYPCWDLLRFSVLLSPATVFPSRQTFPPVTRNSGLEGGFIDLIFLVVSSHSFMTSL